MSNEPPDPDDTDRQDHAADDDARAGRHEDAPSGARPDTGPAQWHDPGTAPAGADDPTAVHDQSTAAGAGPGTPSADADGGAAPGAPGPPPVEGLTRSDADRMLFGVCGGIAARYGFEPLLVRLAFLASLLIGGAGVLFYLAAAVLIPAAPAGTALPTRTSGPAASAAGGVLRLLVGLAVAIAAFFALCAIAAVSFGTTAFLGAWPAAIALLLLGTLLVASARSRRTTGALLVLALALAVPATAAVVADVHVDRSAGQRTVRPGTLQSAEDGYRLGAGQLIVDLRDLPLRDGDHAVVPARVDLGELGVVLPRTRCVAWTIRTDLGVTGATDVLDDDSDSHTWLGSDRGRTIHIDPPRGGDDRRPRVELDLRVGVGHLAVAHSRDAIDGPGPMGRGILSRSDDVIRTTACSAADREQRRG